jgi:hypothetical protein
VAACRVTDERKRFVVLTRGRKWTTDTLPRGVHGWLYSSRVRADDVLRTAANWAS